MNSGKGKYYTVKVTPTCHTSEVDDGENLFLWTEIPNAIPKGNGATSLLKGIQMITFDDHSVDVDLYFAQTKDAATGVTGALGAASTIANMTDAEVQALKPLFSHVVDISVMGRWDATDNAIYTTITDSNDTDANKKGNNLSFPCFSFATSEQVGAGNANPGSIYFMGVASATKTYTASGLQFIFTFES